MVVMHKKNGRWEVFDERDFIAVLLSPQDKVTIENMEDTDRMLMSFPRDGGLPDAYLTEEYNRAYTLAVGREKKVKSGG
jgi:hypothetical protein